MLAREIVLILKTANKRTEIQILTGAFIVMKLFGVIKWSWLWVLSPIWISIVLSIIAFVIVHVTNE